MAVVAAGVHDAGALRCKALPRRSVAGVFILQDAEGVDIKTEGAYGALPAAQDSDYPGVSRLHLLCQVCKGRIPAFPDQLCVLPPCIIGWKAHSGSVIHHLAASQHFIAQIR